VVGSGRTLSQVAGSGRRCVGLPHGEGRSGSGSGCGQRGSGGRCLAADGGGQACGASGCRGQRAAGVRREVRWAADGRGQACDASGSGRRRSGVQCVGLPGSVGSVVRWEVRRAAGMGGVVRQWVWLRQRGQAGSAAGCGRRESGGRCVGLRTAGVRHAVRRVAGPAGGRGQTGGA
jgi:hypothetical protein